MRNEIMRFAYLILLLGDEHLHLFHQERNIRLVTGHDGEMRMWSRDSFAS